VIQYTPDVRLLWAPSETYRAAVAQRDSYAASLSTWTTLVLRLVTPAAIAGIATAVSATGRITWSLALSGTLCWMLIALLQLVTAAAVIVPSSRQVSLSRALTLFFAGHAPWSLWLICAAALIVFARDVALDAILVSASIPLVWTAFVIFGYCRHVLGLGSRAAAIRTIAHQLLTAMVIVLYVGWAIQLLPRLIGMRVP
jgi:hypothetical protein